MRIFAKVQQIIK